MDRRRFLKNSALGLAGLFAARAGSAFAQDPGPSVAFVHPTLASSSREGVYTRLQLFYDVSGSIDTAEHDIQRESIAAAIESEDFRDAVFYPGRPQSIAICVASFGSSAGIEVPWLDIRKGDDHKFRLLAEEVRKRPRREVGNTAHSVGLQYAMTLFEKCPWAPLRSDKGKLVGKNVVDFMTDGETNEGMWPTPLVHQLAQNYDATVNALVTIDPRNPSLVNWAEQNLVTPNTFTRSDGSALRKGFVKVVATQISQNNPGATEEFQDAMKLAFRQKLILEAM